ncbi:MAG: glycosyltransferase family 4 protein [Chitinophagaceae bacterium]|nr:glycosyltransferase family 4 protein [Chitinophagaceae bacterium]
MKNNKKILIIGLFLSEKNKNIIYRTAADQLAEVLSDKGVDIIKSSNKVNKLYRAIDVLFSIVKYYFSYEIAIVPYYASKNAYVIENWSTRLLRILGKKIILVVHGGSIPNRIRGNPKKYLKILHRIDVVVAPSPYLQNELGKYGIQCIVIENVVKLSDYGYIKKEQLQPRILWMRALQYIYYPEMAIKVLAEVKKKYPNATLVMAGKDMGLLKKVKKLATELNVSESITFAGYVHTNQKTALAQKTDIYICTNRIDNAPVTFVEMMTLGLPVVSVNVGGIPYMIKNYENGIYVEFDDAVAMAAAITSLIEDKNLSKKIIANGLVTSRQYSEDAVVKKWLELFSQLS